MIELKKGDLTIVKVESGLCECKHGDVEHAHIGIVTSISGLRVRVVWDDGVGSHYTNNGLEIRTTNSMKKVTSNNTCYALKDAE